ncbi:ATP-binding cassette domain-containing protein [Alkaliphilus serpentinus]|uniref:ABC transporter ATP-binding protein n=1 Tax=Alkaliphilus serpentinus TaxID=1482731 RepID=A0A833MDK1_9FIRM|nr:ABC transporter ATP-binding protein [Alkaliphilus serpentinus]KAB3529075.1 ABC transporter ATP-binding protein [Alkaliphilus serpentinus]
MDDFIIRAKELTKSYGKVRAIDNLSININKGGLIGLIGRNGSGKTTFMKLCAGLLDKNEGELMVLNGEPMNNLEVSEKLVYTYHNIEYSKKIKLIDIIYSFKIMYKNFDEYFALKLLKFFDINSKDKYIQLSQGMMSTFNFICALATRAELTMLDEPVLGMDITVRKAAYEVLLRDYSEYPRTIIISSHILSELEGMLSEILLINKGKLLFYKDIEEIQQIAYRADGRGDVLKDYCRDKKVLYSKIGEFDSFSIIYGKLTEELIDMTKARNIALSKVRPEDLCGYLTQDHKEDELKCLWKK